MSHYHCEIIMPPTDDVHAAVAAVMEPFNEQPHAVDDDTDTADAFWDFWVIGGRWAGQKLIARYDPVAIGAFHGWLDAEHITVSSFTAGKQELLPASQIPKVDAKWNEMFPSPTFVPCPIFKHSNDQYGKSLSLNATLPDDVMRLGEVPVALTCSRVIVAGPSFDYAKEPPAVTGVEATFMLCDAAWNGVNHMKIDWDGRIPSALDQYRATLQNAADWYREARTPTDEWLVVTVDYHS